jgi:hypothetical protein
MTRNDVTGYAGRRRSGLAAGYALAALCAAAALCMAVSGGAVPAAVRVAAIAPAAVARGDAANCGDYQCFYRAQAFLSSVPGPLPGQQATEPLAARAVGPAPGAPSMLVGLDNGEWAFWKVSDAFAQGRSGEVDGIGTGNVFNFDHWQYVDELYYYLHDTVSVPPTQ